MTSQQPGAGGYISLHQWYQEHDRIAYVQKTVELPRLALWDYRDKLSPEDMRHAIGAVWMFNNDGLTALPDLPDIEGATVARLTHDEWVELFRYAGYVLLERDAAEAVDRVCEQPMTLYRYAEHGGQTGLSWTTTVEEALLYEDGFDAAGPRRGCVWRVSDITSERLLAHFHRKILSGNVVEDEYVFDPRSDAIVHVKSVLGCPNEVKAEQGVGA